MMYSQMRSLEAGARDIILIARSISGIMPRAGSGSRPEVRIDCTVGAAGGPIKGEDMDKSSAKAEL